jgi:transposase
VVAVARNGEAPLSQIGKDFGICEPCLHGRLSSPISTTGEAGVTTEESRELRELRRQNKELEQRT